MRILNNKKEMKNKKIKNRLNQTFTDSEISKLKKGYEIYHLQLLMWGDFDIEEDSKDDYLFFYNRFLYDLEDVEDWNNGLSWSEYHQLIVNKLYSNIGYDEGMKIMVDEVKVKRDIQKLFNKSESV